MRFQILAVLCEGSAMRFISRVVDVSINTVSAPPVDAGKACTEHRDGGTPGPKGRYSTAECTAAIKMAIMGNPVEVILETTRAVLDFAEERGLIGSAEEAWNAIITGAEGANPSRHVRVMRPTRAP